MSNFWINFFIICNTYEFIFIYTSVFKCMEKNIPTIFNNIFIFIFYFIIFWFVNLIFFDKVTLFFVYMCFRIEMFWFTFIINCFITYIKIP